MDILETKFSILWLGILQQLDHIPVITLLSMVDIV